MEQLQEEMGLNDPFFQRFFTYIWNIVTEFDFGNSYKSNIPVFNEIFKRFPVSLKLALCGMAGSCLFGIPLGILSAVKQNSKADNIISVIAMTMVAMPSFWVAMILILVFSLYLGWLPSAGASTASQYILPTITIALANGCSVLRITRSSMLDVIRMDYLKTAKAKGVPEKNHHLEACLRKRPSSRDYHSRHHFRFSPGRCDYLRDRVYHARYRQPDRIQHKKQRYSMVTASLIFLAVVYSLVMLCVDLLYAVVDPRIKAKYSGK